MNQKFLRLSLMLVVIHHAIIVGSYNYHPAMSRVYNDRFTPAQQQMPAQGDSGFLDDTFNTTGSLDLSAQLSNGTATARVVVALPNSNFLVALSGYEVDSNVGMYNSEGTLQTTQYAAGSNTPGIVDLGDDSRMVQGMILDAQGRAIICGGNEAASTGWLQRVEADGLGTIVFVEPNDAAPWSNIAAVATQSTGNIIAVGNNGSNAMIARYLVDGSLENNFGTNGYVILNGSNQLPNSTSGIYSVVVDSQDRIYIPYLDTDNTVWIIRLLSDGTPDASWFRSFYGGMTRVGYATTVGTMTTTSSTTATYHTSSSLSHPSSGIATFTVGSSSPYYTGNLTTTSNNNGVFTVSSGPFITNRVAIPYLDGATANQIRMALDVHNNLIIGAQVGGAIKVTGIIAATGESAYLNLFNSSTAINSDQLNLYSLMTTQDNSIVLAGNDQTTGNLAIIKLFGSGSGDGGNLDTTFNGTGYNFFQANNSATTGQINNMCLSPDGRIYAAGYEVVASANVPYLSRLYNTPYDAPTAQFPQTDEQGVVDLSFGNNAQQTYQGVVNPYFGSYRGNLYQQPNAMIEVAYPMQMTNSGVGDLLMGMNGYTNTSSVQSMILTWLTQDGLLDRNFAAGIGQLLLNNVTSSPEQIFGLTQDGSGNIYVAGYCPAGGLVRKYSNSGTSGWTVGNADWASLDESDSVSWGNVALQTNVRVLLLKNVNNETGEIVAFDQATGNLSNGIDGATSFGDGGSGYIYYDSFGLNMGPLLSAVLNDAGDIFVAYFNSNTGYVDVAAMYADGSGLIREFGVNGVVSNLFSPNQQNYGNVIIAKTADQNLVVCSSDNNNVYLAKLEGVTGQLDLTFNSTIGMMNFPLEYPDIYALQGVSDGSILIFGSCNNDTQMFTVRVTSNGILDTTFNAQGSQPGYEYISMVQDANSIYGSALVIQSSTGNIAITGSQYLTEYDASPLVMRSFGAPGTTAVPNYPIYVQYPGTLDLSFNGSGAINVAQLISTGTANKVFAYPAGNPYEGMLLLGINNGTTTVLARVQEQTLALDPNFGAAGIYYVMPHLSDINALSIDALNNILIGGTSAGAGLAQQLTPDAQSYITFNLPTVFPHNVTQINAIGQQESGRYIVVGSDANTDLLIMAFQNQLVDDNTMLALDLTFNPLGIVAPVGTYIVGGAAGALYNLVINDDDTMLVAYQDTINPTTTVLMAKILANGSGLDETFGSGGAITTSILADSGAAIRLTLDNQTNIIVGASYNDSLQAIRYTASGVIDSSWIGSDGAGTPTVITGIGSAGVTLTSLLQTATQQTILLGYNTIQTDQANGPLFAVRLDASGQLDATWNPFPTGFDVQGVLTYFVENASIMNNAWIGVSGNVWVAGTYQGVTPNPILIEIVGDTYVQQVVQDPLASPAGTLDYTLDPSGALNIPVSLGNYFGQATNLYIAPDGSMIIGAATEGVFVNKLLPTLYWDTSFNSGNTGPGVPGQVYLEVYAPIECLFVADATGDDNSIYVCGANQSDYMFAAHISADGSTVTNLTAQNNLIDAAAIRVAPNGNVLISGYNGTSGVVAAFSADMTSLNTFFGSGGYYSTGIGRTIPTMTVDQQGRIYIAYKSGPASLVVQRILADGSGVDTSFNPTITTYACSDTQINLQLDPVNNQLVIVNYADGCLYVNRVSTIDGSDTTGTGGYQILLADERLYLSNCFIDTNQNIYVVGYNTNPGYQIVVARFNSTSPTAIALDTTQYAVVGTPGIANLVAGPFSGDQLYVAAGGLDPDGRVYVVGQAGDSYMARLFGDNYYTQVSQAVSFESVGPATFDATYGTNGLAPVSAGVVPDAGQQARAIVPITTGTNILTLIQNADGSQTSTVRLLTNGTVDPTYTDGGPGNGVVIAQSGTAAELYQGMVFDGTSNAIVFGSNAALGGFIKSILPSGSMNTAFGGSNNGMVYLSQFDIINDVAQLNNGQFVVVGSQAGVGKIAMISLAGQIMTSPAIETFGTNITSVSVDSSNTIYIVYASGLSPIVVNVAKLSSLFVVDTAYSSNATAVLTNINDAANIRAAFDANGQVVVAASAAGTPGAIMFTRLNLDGTIDTTFGFVGLTSISFAANTSANITSLVPLQNGNILAAGYQYDSIDSNNDDYEFVISLTSEGILDTTFNGNGVLTFQVAPGQQEMRNLWGMNIQYDGAILLAGSEESMASVDSPLTMRLDGYLNAKAIQQFTGYVPPTPDPINAQFGIALTTVIPGLTDGGSTVVDSAQRVIVGGITDSNTLIVARFLQNGTLDQAFNGNGIAYSPILTTLQNGFFVAVDIFDNVYISGTTTDNTFVVAKFLGADGSLDVSFNSDGDIPGVAVSTTQIGKTLVSGGYISIDYLGNIVVSGMTSDFNLVVARFALDGTIDTHFGPELPGMNVFPVSNLLYGGYVVTDPSIIQADNSIYVGASITDNSLLIVKLTRDGDLDPEYANNGRAQTATITNLINGGPVALNSDRKVIIGGFTSDKQFVAARFGVDGLFDPTFNGAGISYSNALASLNSCAGICVDSNNNVLLGGTSTAYDGVSISMVVARMTPLGTIDTTLSATGIVTTGTIANLQTGGFVATDALNNIFTGGFDSTKLVVAGLYSGAQIFIDYPQSLPAAVFKIYWYANNPQLFRDYLAAEFYAQLIQDGAVRNDVLYQLNLSLDQYASLSVGQPGINLAACFIVNWIGNLSRLQLALISIYRDSSEDIANFFQTYLERCQLVHDSLQAFNNR